MENAWVIARFAKQTVAILCLYAPCRDWSPGQSAAKVSSRVNPDKGELRDLPNISAVSWLVRSLDSASLHSGWRVIEETRKILNSQFSIFN